ncbi:hypothetical protein [Lysobacter antibioticus]|uniref:hypothetical protein n=1 Tax=Lysobacter antibioticus TaxID=84531 RepID=UPI00164814DB|nr:hypothetical protein [Lysobacter antibioticus]
MKPTFFFFECNIVTLLFRIRRCWLPPMLIEAHGRYGLNVAIGGSDRSPPACGYGKLGRAVRHRRDGGA